MIQRLNTKYGKNNPILLEEIFDCFPEYSKQSVYRMISESTRAKKLIKFENGIYYIPKLTEFGIATPSIERVITKKYICNNDEVFGIFGKWVIELNFNLSTQVPNTIEIITNKASRAVREIEIKGRRIVLRKSRTPITKKTQAHIYF